MKAIHITGKHNIDKMAKIGNGSYKAVRKHMGDLDEMLMTQTYQLELVRTLLQAHQVQTLVVAQAQTLVAQHQSLLLSELNHKIQGYKGQDIKKEIHEQTFLITLEDVLEKLLSSQLTCCYCSKPIYILYKNVREPLQWTLDRIDNDLGHTKANTCISCLKCNLQRRMIDADKFTFTKKLKIQKI
jgi:hypothetical protein